MTRDRGRRAIGLLAVVLAGIVGGLVAIALAPTPVGRVGPGDMTLQALPSLRGTSALALPPFGRVTARTHAAPLRMELRVEELDVDALQSVLEADDPETALRAEVEDDLGPLLRNLALRTIAVAIVGGLVAGALLPRRAAHRFALTGGSAAVVTVGLLLGSWATYDTTAFERARFVGPLERAPALLEAAQRHVRGLAGVRDRIEGLSRQVSAIYAAVQQEPVTGGTTILHVSDIHSNPLGLEIVDQLAAAFEVDAVLDTGDLTSFGHPVEARLGDLLDDIDVPYLFVPGNHDSPENRFAIAATEGVQLLDADVVTVGEVRVLGVADPTYTANDALDPRDADRRRTARAGLVADRVRRARPDLLAVHDFRHGSESTGLVPIIVAGHAHERSEDRLDGSLVLRVGSTGATGLGAFTLDTALPYEAQLLRFDGRRLVAVDYVTLDGVSGEFDVERRLVHDLIDPATVSRTGAA